jgi:hypothetical protein
MATPLVGRDLSPALRGEDARDANPVALFTTDDEISEGDADPASPMQKLARKFKRYNVIRQPNHVQSIVAQVELGGELHTVKYARYHDDQSYWTVPLERDDRLQDGGKLVSHTAPAPDEFELYDLTLDPYEERILAHPSHEDDASRELRDHMHDLLVVQLERQRLVPESGVTPGYCAPAPLRET